MAETSTIELVGLPGSSPDTGNDSSPEVEQQEAGGGGLGQEFSLPPVDRGKDAYLFLLACFMMEALVWGFPFSFGVFQDYYSNHPPFAGSSNIAVIGTCAMGIMYLDGTLVLAIIRKYPRRARWAPFVGLFIMCLALAMSSFSTTVNHLIVTQGVFYAVGGSIAYMPTILYMDEWYVKRKGLAYGIMWSGTGLAGVVLPLLLQYFLNTYGYRTTLRIWACTLFVATMPLAYFIKPRLPISAATHAKPFSLRFALSRAFLLYQTANIVEAVGYFLPTIYLPSYARDTLGAGSFTSALTILLNNVASVFGCVAMGWLIDRLHVTTCIMVSTVGAVAGAFLLWGFASSLPVLYAFCVVYGLFAGAFTSSWPGVMKELAGRGAAAEHDDDDDERRRTDPGLVFAMLAMGRGVGNVASGPLSEVLVKDLPWRGEAAAGYGSGYGSLIVFTGVTALVGGASFLWRRVGWL
ncbi:MFS general substrate transporter [Pleurostoma richardsiae]|uniref:MFS general substrate transporter n=1 Tax=Pleurostoma richardsiae TaxID=41990 RepID=A0AA38VIM2_9PEZI|nr:MFS general substrate transporter [Pleurostoma richardsiae]